MKGIMNQRAGMLRGVITTSWKVTETKIVDGEEVNIFVQAQVIKRNHLFKQTLVDNTSLWLLV